MRPVGDTKIECVKNADGNIEVYVYMKDEKFVYALQPVELVFNRVDDEHKIEPAFVMHPAYAKSFLIGILEVIKKRLKNELER